MPSITISSGIFIAIVLADLEFNFSEDAHWSWSTWEVSPVHVEDIVTQSVP